MAISNDFSGVPVIIAGQVMVILTRKGAVGTTSMLIEKSEIPGLCEMLMELYGEAVDG
jgi:hypothetical protein